MKNDDGTVDKNLKIHKFLKQFGIVFLDIIIVISIFSLIGFGNSFIQKLNKNLIKKQYVGTWKLKAPKDSYFINAIKEIYNPNTGKPEKEEYKKIIIVDKVLKFTEKEIDYHGPEYSDVCYETEKISERCKEVVAVVSLASEKNYVGINFVYDSGDGLTMCFKLENKNTLKQVSCKGVATDEYNPNGFYDNGGIVEELNITYERVD